MNEAGGVRELVVGVDDQQLETDNRSIPRADVAELPVASLEYDSYQNRSFDANGKMKLAVTAAARVVVGSTHSF